MAGEKIKVTVKKYLVELDPPIEVYCVEVARGDGVWDETCSSREHLEIFLRGIQAGSEEYVSLPEIPNEAEQLPKR